MLGVVVGAAALMASSACDPPRECATRVRYTGAVDVAMRHALDIALCRQDACATLVLPVDDSLTPVDGQTDSIRVGCFLDAPAPENSGDASVLTCWLDELAEGPLGPFQDGERLRLFVRDAETAEEIVSLDFSASYDHEQCSTEIAIPVSS